MSLFRNIENLKAQIVDTERMLKLVGDHPIMAKGFKEKLIELNDLLKNFSKEIFEPKIRILFSGNAVKGSIGIKSSFASKVLEPLQEMIKTQAALVRFGNIAKRGGVKKGPKTDLYITALPIGSFGLELSQLESNDLFEEVEVANAMKQIIQLIDSSAKDDESFESAIENSPKRNLTNLKKLLKEISKEESILRIESGNLGIEISETKINEAYNRVAGTIDEENEVFVSGILRGILLDSGKFEIHDANALKISGFISQNLSEEDLIQYNQIYLNKNCLIHLQIHKTEFKTGNIKTTYELIEILNENLNENNTAIGT